MPTWMKVKADHSWGLTCLYGFSASGLHLGPLRRVLLIARILFFFLEQPSPAHKFPASPVLTPLLWKQISSSQEARYWGDSGGKKFLLIFQKSIWDVNNAVDDLGCATENPHAPLLRKSKVAESISCYRCLSSYCVPRPVFTPNNTTLKEVLSPPLSRGRNEDWKSLGNFGQSSPR